MEREAILQLKQSGATYQQIAEMIGRTRTRAMQLINGIGEDIFGPCKDCGQERQLHRHHENYWPEVVVLLCQSCHGRRHVGKILRHKKVIGTFPPNTSLTRASLGKKLGVHTDYAAMLGRMFGFQCTEPEAVPWKSVNWDIPNKWLSRIWSRLPHVCSDS